ncbi:MAG: 5-(carboxyamino)imidazole ribonucleotide synthase [Pseudomonadota bacterium]
MNDAPLPPGSVIGILGGGQLGRMLALAAARLGLRCQVFAPEADPPAGQVCERVWTAGWDDAAALEAFADAVDAATYEFENVPVATVEALAARVPVRPGARSLEAAQDRVAEKAFLRGLALGTAPFAAADDLEGLRAALAEIGAPAVLKTRRMGYDGKGQARIADAAEAEAAWRSVGGAPCVLEGFVAFEREVSVVAARGLDGRAIAYDPSENVHEGGILRSSAVPARLDALRATEARAAAEAILSALGHVGALAVEFFATPGGLLVNEIAPRVHNTGHWTQDACAMDQFEAHMRAVAGWPLGEAARHADAVMTNLLGDEAAQWAEIAADPALRLHLYGKAEARPGRKMGHVNRATPRAD